MDQEIDLARLEKLTLKAMLCDAASRGLYSVLRLNPDWVELKVYDFANLPAPDVKTVFEAAFDVCTYSGAAVEEARADVDVGDFYAAFDKLHPLDRDKVLFGMKELVEREFDWEMITTMPSSLAIKEMSFLRAKFQAVERELRNQINEIVGQDIGAPTLDGSSFEVNLPSNEQAEDLLAEVYEAVCDPYPQPYLFDIPTIRRGLIATEALDRILEEEKLINAAESLN